MSLPGSPLTEADQERILKPRAISVATAAAANLRRVDDSEGRALVGRNGKAGDYSGIAIPYYIPESPAHREFRLRRDKPDLEYDRDGKPKEGQKYIRPPGARSMAYFVPGEPTALLTSADVPIMFTEGEFKALGLADLARHPIGNTAFCCHRLARLLGLERPNW